jgi:hypothetical protein
MTIEEKKEAFKKDFKELILKYNCEIWAYNGQYEELTVDVDFLDDEGEYIKKGEIVFTSIINSISL